ncbi:radical SAM protein, partial [Candidatus Bathyarchaeota archaeon]|nr:radical SAM protein [Candidatus Bathyarchaeota archaeon]
RAAILHAEDVLLYGSRSVMPHSEKVLKLHRLCKEHVASLGWSHTSMAAVAADPQLVKRTAEVILDGEQEWWGAEVGIETGSPELAKKIMPAKARPFQAEQWPEVVKNAASIMMENNLVPACTLITGVPQETEDDVVRTIELVDDLKDFRSLIVPLFFVPLGRLRNRDWFKLEQMNELHKELLVKCLEHDIYWTKILMRTYFRGRWYRLLLSPLYKIFIWSIERKARSEAILD